MSIFLYNNVSCQIIKNSSNEATIKQAKKSAADLAAICNLIKLHKFCRNFAKGFPKHFQSCSLLNEINCKAKSQNPKKQ